MLVEVCLELLVGVIDVKLLKPIHLHINTSSDQYTCPIKLGNSGHECKISPEIQHVLGVFSTV